MTEKAHNLYLKTASEYIGKPYFEFLADWIGFFVRMSVEDESIETVVNKSICTQI